MTKRESGIGVGAAAGAAVPSVALRSRTGAALIPESVVFLLLAPLSGARIGGVVVIAAVPALIGATGGRSYAHALAHGYQPAMIVMGSLCAAAALITALFVTDNRVPGPRIVPRAPEAGCAPCVPAPSAAPDPASVAATEGVS